MNQSEMFYVRGSSIVPLNHQENYVCLRKMSNDLLQRINHAEKSSIIKQRTDEWHGLRNGARVTGSTLYNALGLGSRKDMLHHYDIKFKGKTENFSKEQLENMHYGTENEINALATFVSKIMPVYFPGLLYREDGCELIDMGCDVKGLVSGDGSCITAEEPTHSSVEVEFKCPRTGKRFMPDVWYSLPERYSTQVMMEMSSHNTENFANICWTPESSTFIYGKFDSDLWKKLQNLTQEVLGGEKPKRPQKTSDSTKSTKTALKTFCEETKFVAEFPSVYGEPCHCLDVAEEANVYGQHNQNESKQNKKKITPELFASYLHQAKEAITEAYNLLRRPSKEIIAVCISDLERLKSADLNCHAALVSYYMGGFSLPMQSVRGILNETIQASHQRDLRIKAIAFDGQFLEIALLDDTGRPLTIWKLEKIFWKETEAMKRADKLSYIYKLCLDYIGTISSDKDVDTHFSVTRNDTRLNIQHKKSVQQIYSGKDIGRFTVKKNKQSKIQGTLTEDQADDHILQYLPEAIVSTLDARSLEAIEDVNRALSKADIPSEPTDDTTTNLDNSTQVVLERTNLDKEIELESILCALIAGSSTTKWDSITTEELQAKLHSAIAIDTYFTVKELQMILGALDDTSVRTMQRKSHLVNRVCELLGDGTRKPETPKPLKQLVKSKIEKYPIAAINVIHATNAFPLAYKEWESENTFRNNSSSIKTDTGGNFDIEYWYAQAAKVRDVPNEIQFIIDPHHILVNNRCRVSSKGLPRMGIRKEAWVRVAEDGKTDLTVEHVVELRDRQRNSFAQLMFSHEVEQELRNNGDSEEAEWCRVFLHWYRAVDDSGIELNTRIQWLLDMRDKLLKQFPIGQFPPPAAYCNDLPVAQFEGILTNIDRRLQLYAMTSNSSYNQRSVSSLDSENIFGAFQEYDPKGTGVLRADDIPTALGTATCLLKHRLNENRGFAMNTTKRSRVYQSHPLQDAGTQLIHDDDEQVTLVNGSIYARSHVFDKESGVKKSRKSHKITEFNETGRGSEGVRSHHKINEEKILAHRRSLISDSSMDKEINDIQKC